MSLNLSWISHFHVLIPRAVFPVARKLTFHTNSYQRSIFIHSQYWFLPRTRSTSLLQLLHPSLILSIFYDVHGPGHYVAVCLWELIPLLKTAHVHFSNNSHSVSFLSSILTFLYPGPNYAFFSVWRFLLIFLVGSQSTHVPFFIHPVTTWCTIWYVLLLLTIILEPLLSSGVFLYVWSLSTPCVPSPLLSTRVPRVCPITCCSIAWPHFHLFIHLSIILSIYYPDPDFAYLLLRIRYRSFEDMP